jgi:Met-zincin/Domain of unknown function (DUF5117)/Domain of unknown function (DUF5118)
MKRLFTYKIDSPLLLRRRGKGVEAEKTLSHKNIKINSSLLNLLIILFSIGITTWACAQDSIALAVQPQDTTQKETPSSVPAGNTQLSAPRNYNYFMRSNPITRKGLFTIHKIEDKYYFEIPDSLLGRDILVVGRIAQGAAGIRPEYTGYAGDQIGNTVIRFEKGPGHKLFLRRITYQEHAGDSTDAMHNAVVRSNLQPLVAAFGISAYSPNDHGSVIDITDYINGDNEIFFFNAASRKVMKIGSLMSNTSYIKDINSFPLNLEIRTIKTYSETSSDNSFTVELNTSFVLLPKKPMRKRLADRRVGYFTERYTDYDVNPQGVKVINYIKRWRLEPKPEDLEKYKRGELVEPQKPIIYYIDPATPKKWVPYLIQGINDWQVAFEKAGFKNAIIAREAPDPKVNPDWSLEDSRHSAIVYKPSSFANAAGPIITDPRSGEILESHINWYHNLMSILRDWYMVQCGPVDPRAQRMKFDDELMGQLIRSVASHEVGHSLGLTHNFGASSTVPVEKLRDRTWLSEHGITPSIMDYARFNYVAQPEDSIPEKNLIAHIGDYDVWAIQYGYRLLPDISSPETEIPFLNGWIIDKMKNKNMWYGSEFSTDDPRTQMEDVGDNAMKAGEYGIRNLQRVVPRLLAWTYEKNEGYRSLNQIYSGLITQFDYYVEHVLSYFGGTYETAKTAEQPGPVYEPVGLQLQLEAMDFVTRHVFHTPQWLLDSAVLARTGQSPIQIIGRSQETVLNRMLGTNTLGKMVTNEALYGTKTYKLTDYLDDIDKAMWMELKNYDAIDLYRRNLQRFYIDRLIELAPATANRDTRDVSPWVRNKLAEIQARLKKAISKTKDPVTIKHLKYLDALITESKAALP